MAIKGKSKPKGGAKTVTRGPRPAYVPVHTPLLRRRSFWFTVLGVVVVASALGIWYGIAQQREADREQETADRLREAVAEYQRLVEPAIAPVGEPVPPSGLDAFADLTAALDAFIDTGDPGDLETIANTSAEVAASAAEGLEAIEPATIMGGKGFQETDVLYVLNSHSRMSQALRLFEQAALLAADAATTDGDPGVELGTRAKGTADLAGELFADGYQDYVEAQFRARVFEPVPPTGAAP